MAVTLGLGFRYNVCAGAGGVWLNLRDADAIDFLCVLAAGDTFTLQEAVDNIGTGAKNLPIITTWYTTTIGGQVVWAKNTQAAAATVVTTGTATGAALFAVNENSLDDGYHYVKVTATGAGVVTAITHDLAVQRTPALLTAPGI